MPGIGTSPARMARRAHIVEAARALVGAKVDALDPVRAAICAVDVVMVAGSPWLKDGLERDFAKDEGGYRKIGGGANGPEQAYFFRAPANLIHYLKRAGFYVPRGGHPEATAGMACFFDWDDDRGRFNFKPDRSGIVVDVRKGRIARAVIAQSTKPGFRVDLVDIEAGGPLDRALIGYSDLP
jgi:hypothetical protein